MGQAITILGGVRSGKSSFAEDLAQQLGEENVTYLATAEAGDEEMSRRIERHQSSRPEGWKTVESRRELAKTISQLLPLPKVILLDCLTIWISNILLDAGDVPFEEIERQMRIEIEQFLEAVKGSNVTVIVVAGEVGMGVVPETLLGRQFRDLHGWANQTIVEASSNSYLMIAGRAVNLDSISNTVERCAQECQP
ncbi:MAG: bifunctional adenosylcobinamide kinase/adenosylcobinamide-phosphate guanylyltransferase [Planctomycetaceae bacterium]|nr:bifunctional adenosylcobinamide kinase/adenosylcobinamide-phosphate guanylyltransferase [Planctomycetaceae bacterium]